MTVGSLFSGIGGFDLGFERAGFDITWQVEIDDYANRVLAKHWPHVARYRDVRECGAANLAPVDVIAGGFPCQPVSRSGKQLAQADDRWLWPEFRRIVCELGPRFVVLENVPGLFDGGIADVLGDLADLGFDAEWSVISACSMGAPQTRERVFLVAYPAGLDGFAWDRVASRREWGSQIELGGLHGFDLDQRGQSASAWSASEPLMARMADGIPAQVDRLHAIGNAIVPQIAEWIARRILQAEEGRQCA